MAPPAPEQELALREHEEALERDAEHEIGVRRLRADVEAVPSGQDAPFDLEHDAAEPGGPQPTLPAGSNAPFDLERESIRAA
jgi:hypothetical protein